MFLQILQIHKKSTCAKELVFNEIADLQSLTLSRKRLQHKCFLVNSAKYLINLFLKNHLDSCFYINTSSIYCPTTTFSLFKNDFTHIFRLSIFSAYFVDWKQEWAQYFKPQGRSLFSTQPNIYNGAFLQEIVNSLIPLGIFAKNLHYRCSTRI